MNISAYSVERNFLLVSPAGISFPKKAPGFSFQGGLLTLFLISLFILPVTTTTYAQNRQGKATNRVSGSVTDESGGALPGVNIRLKNENNVYAITDSDGKFSITVKDQESVLVFSYIGFVTKSVEVKNQSALQVQMQPDDKQLNEVVVIGYGTSTREKLTGSVVKISAKEIQNQPVSNPLSALQGRTPGVLITSGAGVPGSTFTVQVRGSNTIASGSNPLYLIDGVALPSSTISYLNAGAAGQLSPLNTINPADIESIEVLKDADATAIYGSRGANGVVLITTKKGKAGKTKFEFDFYTGSSKVTRTMDVLSTAEYLDMRRAAFTADKTVPTAANAPDLLVWDQNQFTDWQKYLIGNKAPVKNAQINISGGSQQTRFILGGSYRDEGAVLMGNNFDKRANGKFNILHSSKDERFNLSATATYAQDRLKITGPDSYRLLMTAPNMPMYDSTGTQPYWVPGSTSVTNPTSYEHMDARATTETFIGNVTIRYHVVKNLEAKLDIGYSNMNQKQVNKYGTGYLNPADNYAYDNYTNFSDTYSNTFNVEPQVNYAFNIGKGRLSALAGSTIQKTVEGRQYIVARDFPTDDLMGSLAAAAEIATRNTAFSEYKFQSVFGRLNYEWESRYIVNGVYRRDGSSRFGPGNRYGNFWSVGGAWIFSKEQFLQNTLALVSYGKLRSSYGVTGNDQIPNYEYLQTFTSTTYNYEGEPGLYPNRLANDDYSWESNKKFEVAMELGFIKNRLLLNAAWYQNRSSNQLVRYPLPSQSGFSYYQANLPALIQNRGLELDLTSKNIVTKDFQWTSTFNITIPKNTLLKFPGLSSSNYANTYEIGKSINVFRLYKSTGVNPETGLPQVEDRNGDGQYTSANDYQSVGTKDPGFYGGLGNSFHYKGFDLDIFFQFHKQKTAYGYKWLFYNPIGFMNNVASDIANDYWTTPGQPASNPGLTASNSTPTYSAYYNLYAYSDAALSNGSFIRLKNVSLSYNLPAGWLKTVKMEDARLYVQGQNLLTFTNYDGYDPETPRGIPPLKTITAGIRFSF